MKNLIIFLIFSASQVSIAESDHLSLFKAETEVLEAQNTGLWLGLNRALLSRVRLREAEASEQCTSLLVKVAKMRAGLADWDKLPKQMDIRRQEDLTKIVGYEKKENFAARILKVRQDVDRIENDLKKCIEGAGAELENGPTLPIEQPNSMGK